jgi:hypothetical protein
MNKAWKSVIFFLLTIFFYQYKNDVLRAPSAVLFDDIDCSKNVTEVLIAPLKQKKKALLGFFKSEKLDFDIYIDRLHRYEEMLEEGDEIIPETGEEYLAFLEAYKSRLLKTSLVNDMIYDEKSLKKLSRFAKRWRKQKGLNEADLLSFISMSKVISYGQDFNLKNMALFRTRNIQKQFIMSTIRHEILKDGLIKTMRAQGLLVSPKGIARIKHIFNQWYGPYLKFFLINPIALFGPRPIPFYLPHALKLKLSDKVIEKILYGNIEEVIEELLLDPLIATQVKKEVFKRWYPFLLMPIIYLWVEFFPTEAELEERRKEEEEKEATRASFQALRDQSTILRKDLEELLSKCTTLSFVKESYFKENGVEMIQHNLKLYNGVIKDLGIKESECKE